MLQSASVEAVVWEAGLETVVLLLNNRQQRYALGLLTAPKPQPTREIMSVTLQERE